MPGTPRYCLTDMTADERLAVIGLRIERARKHLRELEGEVNAFLATEPYKVGVKRDPDTRRMIYYVTEVRDTPAPLGAIAGDVIHSARTALDHLAYQLVLVGTGRPGPFKRVYFPIADSAVEYEAAKTKETTLMPAAAMAAIDALKPYRGGNDVLWRLHRLDDVDKHRVLLTVGSNFESVNVAPVVAPPPVGSAPDLTGSMEGSGWPPDKIASVRELAAKMALFSKPADRPFSLTVGAELLIDAPDAEPNPAIQFRLGVALSEPSVIDGEPMVETLQAMIATVEKVAVSFKALLE